MKTSVVLQPSNAEMGEIIKGLLSLQNPFYSNVWLVSAFANAQAVQRITPNILEAKARGANIHIIVGFDVKSTSAEALKAINSLGVNAVLVHNARGGHTFHPKVYLFEAPSERADVFAGSNNLTDGGLFTNYEASTRTTFELPAEDEEYALFFSSLEVYLKPTGPTVRVLTQELIDILVARGDVPNEEEIRKTQATTLRSKKNADIPASPFGVEKIKRPPKLKKSPKKPSAAKTSSVMQPVQASNSANWGELLWQKTKLPASDVQKQSGNVTGGLRLTQAGWKVSGNPIDQTTYFRNDVFGHLIWSSWKTKPSSEKTEANFEVYLLGKNHGIHELHHSRMLPRNFPKCGDFSINTTTKFSGINLDIQVYERRFGFQRNIFASKDASVRGLGSIIPLDGLIANAFFGNQFERRLKEVDVRP